MGSRSLGLYFTLLFPGHYEVSSACHMPLLSWLAKGGSLLKHEPKELLSLGHFPWVFVTDVQRGSL